MSENPYAAPHILDHAIAQPGDAEEVRRQHINTEASIKSIGILYYLGGIGLLFAAGGFLMSAGPFEGVTSLAPYATAGLLVIFSIFQFFVGSALRKLKSWSRIAAGILSGIGLLGFPIGTIINAYILFLIFGKKGAMVFSEPYKAIIASTPHVKYKTSKVLRVLLGIFAFVILLSIIIVVIGKITSTSP
ncbi:MAG TPA: hypothetical protein VF258_09530 [Luteolibacter sp.]